jgi:hypothetical protein
MRVAKDREKLERPTSSRGLKRADDDDDDDDDDDGDGGGGGR